MKIIVYHLELLEPALVTSLQGDPNSAVAFDYLPGSVLRGAIIGRYMQQNGLSHLDETAGTVRDLFFNGRIRYLNGYPLEENRRSLPVPRSWRRKKEDEASIYDFAVESGDPDEDWQGLNRPFWLPVSSKARLIKPDRHIAVHIARDRHWGRDDNETSQRAVYRYDALAPGQTFAAAILCEKDELAVQLQTLLTGKWFVGGSRSGGYGGACITHVQEIEGRDNWRETDAAVSEQEQVTVTLLSDALLRDSRGQIVVNQEVVVGAIAQALGVSELNCHSAFLATEPIGGFNRAWGLPLPQAAAVARGSTFVFESPNCTAEKLRDLEWNGIGERRSEGFGRLAVNWLDEPEWAVEREAVRHKPKPVAITADDRSARIAGEMAARLLRQKIESQIAEKANQLGPHIKGVKRNQLSRLRSVIQNALYQEPTMGRSAAQAYLRDLQGRKVTRNQFEKAKVGGQPLLRWLQERVSDNDTIWRYLSVDVGTAKIGDVAPTLTTEMAYEYNLQLVDAVLARAAKQEETGL